MSVDESGTRGRFHPGYEEHRHHQLEGMTSSLDESGHRWPRFHLFGEGVSGCAGSGPPGVICSDEASANPQVGHIGVVELPVCLQRSLDRSPPILKIGTSFPVPFDALLVGVLPVLDLPFALGDLLRRGHREIQLEMRHDSPRKI
ncbi:hypothetical protein I0Q12_00015 [Rhodococcus sp. CX]|uniref:hypothetical protein n=1 Tax=Rhodococcus sp. CX TaxID=2789880 RepID=UPI0018CFB4B0|nr:hypothetical protein [Rhodococcus sp. CX]MBH0118001.1 hypothetical protein [Rhodococcus sp. CX]